MQTNTKLRFAGVSAAVAIADVALATGPAALRDPMRKWAQLVRQRTTNMLSINNQLARIGAIDVKLVRASTLAR